MQKSVQKNNRAFTIIETLIAIAVILTGAVAPISLLQRGINSATYAREKVTALFLAEDALEYIKNVRDSDVISTHGNTVVGTNEFLGTVVPRCINRPCRVDTTIDSTPSNATTPTVVACTGTCPALNYSSSLYAYAHQSGAGWAGSIYTRTMTVTQFSSQDYRVRVVVTWKGNTVSMQRNFKNVTRNPF